MASFFPGLHRAAPQKLELLIYRPLNLCSVHRIFTPTRNSSLNQIVRLYNNGCGPTRRARIANKPIRSRRIKDLARSLSSKTLNFESATQGVGSRHSTSSFPARNSKSVAYWLLGSAASVFGIVVFGGLTRLSESGLSITEWKPVTGALPPMSLQDWEVVFEKYKASPEYKQLNPNMTLPEFKKIYYMEWGHRLWGRMVGMTFVIPAVYFVARRRVTMNMSLRLLGISGLIGFQGFLGWWMVKSGLHDDLFAPGAHPRVSQYRLTAHLGAAFVCYTAMLWNGLAILKEHAHAAFTSGERISLYSRLKSPQLSVFRKSAAGLILLVFITAMSGGLVAGLDAGLIYNEFPYMGNGLTPPRSELFSDFYSRRADGSDIWWRNMLENPSTVQLQHRILATTTFTAIMCLFAYSRFNPRVASMLPKNAKAGMMGMVHLALMQVSLGLATLLYLVPIHVAAAHQAGSLALLTGALVLGSRLSVPRLKGLSGVSPTVLKRAIEASAQQQSRSYSTLRRAIPTPTKYNQPLSLTLR